MVSPNRSFAEQIADALRADIASGALPVGGPCPTEPEIAARFEVSRVTANRAVGLLRADGLVEVRRGVGAVVIGDHVPFRVEFPRDVWAQVSDAADQDDVTVGEWIVAAVQERRGGTCYGARALPDTAGAGVHVAAAPGLAVGVGAGRGGGRGVSDDHTLRVGDIVAWGDHGEHRGHVVAVRDTGIDVVPTVLEIEVDPAGMTLVVRREDRDDYR